LSQFHFDDNRDTYTEIAKRSNVETVKNHCQESFQQFYTNMQEFVANEGNKT
jgi:hypothetical protein